MAQKFYVENTVETMPCVNVYIELYMNNGFIYCTNKREALKNDSYTRFYNMKVFYDWTILQDIVVIREIRCVINIIYIIDSWRYSSDFI